PLVAEAEALVVVVNRDRQHLFRPLLADHVLIELLLDGARRGDVGEEGLGDAAAAFFLIDDRLTELDALATDVDVAGSLDKGADIAVALAAERTVGIAVPSGAAGCRSLASAARSRVFRCHAISFVDSRSCSGGLSDEVIGCSPVRLYGAAKKQASGFRRLQPA